MRRFPTACVLFALSAVLVVCAGCTTPGGVTGPSQSTPTPSIGSVSVEGNPFPAAAAAVKPSVVNVGIEEFVPGLGSSAQQVGNGSGIIIRQDGYILTNDHVVAGSSGITAVIGTETVKAKVIGRDPTTDLAVVKVDRTGLDAAKIGDPSQLKVGDWVIAVGYPFDIGKTVTHGIISALGQESPGPIDGTTGQSVAAYANLIQTDAAINPGNSGGALATMDGRVVGVNSLIESPSGASAGIGFAIPIDYAMNIADQLIKTGKAVHPLLGVGIVSLTPHVAAALGVKATEGALVRSVKAGGPAAKAGVKTGDVIVGLAGQPVTNVSDVYAILRKQRIGATVPLRIDRDGRILDLKVTIGSG